MATEIKEPSTIDVLCGRGGKTNHHPGNIRFREMISEHHLEYTERERKEKTAMTLELLQKFRAQGVRFLREDTSSKLWIDVGDQHARTKISQALRDNTSEKHTGETSSVKRQRSSQQDMDVKRVKLPEEPNGTNSITMDKSKTVREVSPVPSTESRLSVAVPSLLVEKKPLSLRTHTRQSFSCILPPEASLFEIIEGSVTNLELPSKTFAVKKSPFVLPDLPSAEMPASLLTFRKENVPVKDIGFNGGYPFDNESPDSPEATLREVSPLPRSLGGHLSPVGTDTGDEHMFELPDLTDFASSPEYDPYVKFLAEDSPLPPLHEEYDQTEETEYHEQSQGYSSIRLLTDHGIGGSLKSAFNPVQPSPQQ